MLNKETGKENFDDWVKECIYIGYAENSKAYRLWQLNERTIVPRCKIFKLISKKL